MKTDISTYKNSQLYYFVQWNHDLRLIYVEGTFEELMEAVDKLMIYSHEQKEYLKKDVEKHMKAAQHQFKNNKTK